LHGSRSHLPGSPFLPAARAPAGRRDPGDGRIPIHAKRHCALPGVLVTRAPAGIGPAAVRQACPPEPKKPGRACYARAPRAGGSDAQLPAPGPARRRRRRTMLMVWQAPGGDDPWPRLGLAGASCRIPRGGNLLSARPAGFILARSLAPARRAAPPRPGSPVARVPLPGPPPVQRDDAPAAAGRAEQGVARVPRRAKGPAAFPAAQLAGVVDDPAARPGAHAARAGKRPGRARPVGPVREAGQAPHAQGVRALEARAAALARPPARPRPARAPCPAHARLASLPGIYPLTWRGAGVRAVSPRAAPATGLRARAPRACGWRMGRPAARGGRMT